MTLADSLTLNALAVDPYGALAPLRAQGGAHWAPHLDMWVVVRHADVVSVLRQPELFSNDSEHSLIQRTFGRQMLSVEGEEHRVAKQACLAPFQGPAVRDVWTPRVEALCQELLDELSGGNPPNDLMRYAAGVALRSMGMVIGLETRDLGQIHSWYADFAQALANFEGDASVASAGVEAAEKMRSHLDGRLRAAEAGEVPEFTLVSHLAQGEALDRTGMLANLLIVLFGGIETTESMIGNALWCAFTQGHAGTQAPTDDAALDELIEESLRFEPAVQTLTRHATQDTELLGQAIRKGDTVQCMVSSANRDPALFSDPDRFEPGRANSRKHLSFGLGSHFCLGAPLARLETRCALQALFARFPGVDLQGERYPPYGHEFRKPPRLEVDLGLAGRS